MHQGGCLIGAWSPVSMVCVTMSVDPRSESPFAKNPHTFGDMTAADSSSGDRCGNVVSSMVTSSVGGPGTAST